MPTDVTSKRLMRATELMLVVPIRPGFVDGAPQLISYATRLNKLLNALFVPRRIRLERDRLFTADPIDSLQSIYASQWGVLEEPGASKLLVCSTFDRPWEEYFQLLVDRTGPLLDALFCHCEGYDKHTCADGFERFARWIRRHQISCGFFYMSAPDLTVDDLRHARRLLPGGGPAQLPLASLAEEETRLAAARKAELCAQRGITEQDFDRELVRKVRAQLSTLFALRKLFPGGEVLVSGRTDEEIFDGAMAELLRPAINKMKRLALQATLPPSPELAWGNSLLALSKPSAAVPQRVRLGAATLEQIQANILESINSGDSLAVEEQRAAPRITHGCVVLIQCDDARATRRLLAHLRSSVTSAAKQRSPASDERRLFTNLAFTYAGLARLCREDVLKLVPKEFKEGLAARATSLGDVGFPNHPDYWQLPELNWPPDAEPSAGQDADRPRERVSLSSIDVVLVLQGARDDVPGDHEWSRRHPLFSDLEGLGIESNGGRILHVQALRRYDQGGHFGMIDGRGQPVPDVSLDGRDLAAAASARDKLPLGELLLGYPNRRDHPSGEDTTTAQDGEYLDIFRDGSFLVMRKLAQNVEELERFLEQNASQTGSDPARVKGWVLGRDDAGKPLTPGGGANDFDYSADPGVHCPFHAHIRLANPRSSASGPRIMRRSFSYGARRSDAPGPQERGLMFMAYNASLGHQYEVVQRWLNGGNSTGLPSTQNDLLTGVPQPSAPHWVIHDGAWKALAPPERPLVALRWGLYLFVPSLRAIDKLMAGEPDAVEPAGQTERGRQLIDRLNAIEDKEAARRAWKEALEEDEHRERAAAIWAAVRAGRRPVHALHYGWLVADLENARAVLNDDGRHFSVSEYGERLRETIGPHYLGVDQAAPDASRCSYRWLAELPNRYLRSTPGTPDLWNKAREVGYGQLRGATGNGSLSVLQVAILSIGELAQWLLGIPGGPTWSGAGERKTLAGILEHFINISRYCFQPYPDLRLATAAKQGGEYLREHVYGAEAIESPFAKYLREIRYEGDHGLAVMGAIVGFAPPAVKSLWVVTSQWLNSGEFWRLRIQCKSAQNPRDRRDIILQSLLGALRRAPVPALLYRVATQTARLAGVPIQGKGKIIIGLQALMLEADQENEAKPEQWMFGGDSAEGAVVHGCPGREPALQMLGGVLDALLACGNLRREGPDQISFSFLDAPDLSREAICPKQLAP